MSKAYIYVGGEVFADALTERPAEGDLVIAADSGYDNAVSLGVTPQILVGDMDSIRGRDFPKELEIYQVPAEKNQTDTQLAVDLALSKGVREIVIVGGLSGRLDHTMSNLGVLEKLHELHVHAVICDGANRVRLLRNASTLIPRGGYTYLSLLAADRVVRGVEVQGVKYPLKRAKLTNKNQYAVSNELTGNCALIAVRRGGVFVIESKDKERT